MSRDARVMTAQVRREVSVVGLTKRYGAVAALDSVSLEIGDGTFMTLLGPSGSGKTTLLMAIAGFVEPDAGEIRMNDRDISRLPPERRNFGMVFQGYALFPHLSVANNVAFPLRLRGIGRAEREERVRQALDLVQLGDLGARMPRQLSGGQQQRVALARALVFEPDVLLLDEPLSALDKKLRADLQWELKDIHRRLGITFICVTHDQDEALSMSDRIAILRHGRIVQDGTPAELYEQPRTRFAAEFLGQSNFLTGQVVQRNGGDAILSVGGQLVRQAVSSATAIGDTMTVALRPAKIRLEHGEGQSDSNSLPGTLLDWNYHGATLHCRVNTAAAQLFVVLPTWDSVFTPRRGQSVRVEWSATAGQIVADDQ